MITWKLFADDRIAWDKFVDAVGGTWGYQSWGWGEFKRGTGWITERWQGQDAGGALVATVQVLLRKIPGVGFLAWIPGGPSIARHTQHRVGDLLDSFRVALEMRCGNCYLRSYFMLPHDGYLAYDLSKTMVRPLIQLGSGFSIQFDFGPDENTWFKEMTAKHRYYARKALQTKNLSWRYGDEYELMETLADLGKRMQDKKKIPAGNYTLNELTQMQKSLSGSLRVLIGYLGDNPISACLTMRSGSEAIYVNAATIGPGRDIGAAYAMFVMLRRHLKNENIDKFDFGGIAPCTALASGVDHFKLGFGGRVIEYLGEWEAGGWMTRAAGNAAVFLSQQRQRIRS